jgi:hypothetical protein
MNRFGVIGRTRLSVARRGILLLRLHRHVRLPGTDCGWHFRVAVSDATRKAMRLP